MIHQYFSKFFGVSNLFWALLAVGGSWWGQGAKPLTKYNHRKNKNRRIEL
jgi:hypothetical protein